MVPPTFVQADGTRFVVDGEDFPVVGVNCYFLSYCTDDARAETLDRIKATGASVVRTAAFLNSRERPARGPCFQYSHEDAITINDGPDGLGRLDGLLEAAEDHGVRLILPLVNYWDDLGGMSTYLGWLFPGETLGPEEFYRRPQARDAFKNWIGHLLNRVSTRSNYRYSDSPAIMAWELANEPRCPLADGCEMLLEWAQDIARFIKQEDPNHLVALGDEGFFRRPNPRNHLYSGKYGVDFEAALAIPEIDFGTYHFYPGTKHMNVPLEFASTWIEDHVDAGDRAGKPVVLEEYGIGVGDDRVTSARERDEWYARWLRTIHDKNGAGDLLWMIGSNEPSVARNRDDYTICDIGEIPALADHARDMSARSFGV